MYKIHEQVIDTSSQGQVFLVTHNLGGLPIINLWESSEFGDLKYVSLYDPRIESIETTGTNEIKFSFASAFSGRVQLVYLDLRPDDINSTLRLHETRLSDLTIQQRQFVSKSSWTSMNSYLENEIAKSNSITLGLETDITYLKEDVANL